jgi:hypothetical protein
MAEPEILLLRPNRLRWVLQGTACAGLTGLGLWLVMEGKRFGWPLFVFFALCTLVALAELVGDSHLRLTHYGLEVKTLTTHQAYRWQDILWFGVLRMSFSTFVAFRFADSYGGRRTVLREMTHGADGMLPDNYGMSADELARLLADWRNRHVPSA